MKLFFKAISHNKTSFIIFLLTNFLLSAVIFSVLFFLSSLYIPVVDLSKNLKNDDYIIADSCSKYDNYFTSEEIESRIEYYFGYINIEGDEYSILYLNEKGFKKGAPCFINNKGVVTIFPFEDVMLEEEKIYTNDKNLIRDNIEYKNYFENRKFENIILKYEIEINLICIKKEPLEELSVVIYENPSNKDLYSTYGDELYGYGRELKKAIKNSYEVVMDFQTSISIIPILFSFFILVQFYSYFISMRKNDIIILNIFYLSMERLIRGFTLSIFMASFLCSFLAVLISYFIFIRTYFSMLFIAFIILFILQYLVIHRNVKKLIKFWLNNKGQVDEND